MCLTYAARLWSTNTDTIGFLHKYLLKRANVDVYFHTHFDSIRLERDQKYDLATDIILKSNKGYKLKRNNDSGWAFKYLKTAADLSEGIDQRSLPYYMANYYFGDYLEAGYAHDLALIYLNRCKAGLDSLISIYPPSSKGNYYGKLSNNYYLSNQVDSALFYQHKLLVSALITNNILIVPGAYNNYGLFLTKINRLGEAEKAFVAGMDYLEDKLQERRQKMAYVNIKESLSHIYFKRGDHNTAFALLEETYSVRKQLGVHLQAMQALNYILDYLIKLDKPKQAYQYFIKEKSYFLSDKNLNKRTIEMYKTASDLIGSYGNKLEAQDFLTTYNEYYAQRYFEEVQNPNFSQNIREFINLRNDNLDQAISIEKFENDKLSNQLKMGRTFNMLIIFLCVLSTFLVYFLYRLNKVAHQKRLEEEKNIKLSLELENQNLKVDLVSKQKDLARISSDNRLKRKVKKELLVALKQVAKKDLIELKPHLKHLIINLETTTNSQMVDGVLQENLSIINAQLEDKLKDLIPNITPQEIKVCSLLKLEMTTGQIANLLNKSESTIRSYLFRIRQKSNIEDTEELKKMIGET